MNVSFIIPSYNNLQHLKNAYASIKKHAPETEVILLDDGSTDGTWEWIFELADMHQHREVKCYRSVERLGHTILYDKGIAMATNDIVGILHADMILGPNYIENMIKHLQPGKVVCATRIEPPLHPPGKEKIIQDFGQDFDTLNVLGFELYCQELQKEFKDQTTKGMFAPWIIYKKDFQSIGGHDPLFAPFPYEDSDIFQRWILNGFELIQSRDAFVYHLTCRGHRWNEQVGKDDEFYKTASLKAARNYIRKWGSWIRNDEYQHPIVPHKYDIHCIIHNCNHQLLELLEPWFSCTYTKNTYGYNWADYRDMEQSNTLLDMGMRVADYDANTFKRDNIDILVEFDAAKFTQRTFDIIQNLSDILSQSGEVGEFELDCLRITITKLTPREHELIINQR